MGGALDGAHWEKRARKSSWKKLTDYCKKDGDFVTNIPPTPEEEGIAAQRARMVGIRWLPWQSKVIKMVREREPDYRRIYWFWESSGRVGKSLLATYLTLEHRCLIVSGKSSDVLHQLAKYREDEKANPRVIIYDIPRTAEGFVKYGLMEQLKNGVVFSGKYEGSRLILPPMWMLVFANFPPEEDKMSRDRWRVSLIEDILDSDSETDED